VNDYEELKALVEQIDDLLQNELKIQRKSLPKIRTSQELENGEEETKLPNYYRQDSMR